jgi:hypothetical protein
MAEPTQFSFDLKEVATALVKQQGLHEGHWLVTFELNLAAGIIGQTPATSMPAAFVQINRLQLVRQDQVPSPHPHLTVDAAEVNPKTKSAPSEAEYSVRGGSAAHPRRSLAGKKNNPSP